jgi:hypothetical protein
MKRKLSTKYGEYEVVIKMSTYSNGQKRMDLIDSEDGFPVAVATVAIEEDLPEGEIAIKDYSENEGVLNFLISEGIVSDPLRHFSSGFVKIPICKINETFLES